MIDTQAKVEEIEKQVFELIDGFFIDVNSQKLGQFAQNLINVKTISNNVHVFKNALDQKLGDASISLKKKKGGAKIIAQLGTRLSQDEGGVVKVLLPKIQLLRVMLILYL